MSSTTSSPLRMEEDNSESLWIFSATIQSLSDISILLKSIAFSDKINLFISPDGLKWVVEEGKYVQAVLLMQSGLFEEFSVHLPSGVGETCFKISLKELLECLKIFSSDGKSIDKTVEDTSCSTTRKLKLMYKRIGAPFEFILHESICTTEFRVKTEDVGDLMDFEIEAAVKVVMKAELFFQLLAEVENNSPEQVNITVEPRKQMMVIGANGISGLMEVMIPSTSAVVEFFQCANDSVVSRATYRTAILKLAFKALQVGEKLVLKIDKDGLLSLSFLFNTKAESFIEFFCLPTQEENE